MGVFNGSFVGISKGTARSATFTGESKSSRKNRIVTMRYLDGRPVEVAITPAQEHTNLSDPQLVTKPVTDPVRAVERLINAKGCPAALRLYDARRVITITPSGLDQAANTLTCNMRYKVTDGPGHLSPLRISSAKMRLQYDISGGRQMLEQIKISSGIFSLHLDRLN